MSLLLRILSCPAALGLALCLKTVEPQDSKPPWYPTTIHKGDTMEWYPQKTHEYPEKPECPHETCRISAQFAGHVKRTNELVSSWKVQPAVDTDRVAVTVFQPPTPESLYYFNYTIRANLHRLGPKWALQIFYGKEEDREVLSEALGSPQNVIWTPIYLNGTQYTSINKKAANWFRLSMDFWGKIPSKYEHIFIFESDSLVLRGHDCINAFVGFDYVGAPWDKTTYFGRSHPPNEGGNGGLTLRRRSTMIKVVQSELNKKNLQFGDYINKIHRKVWAPHKFPQHEDGEVVLIMKKLNYTIKDGNFPNRIRATQFAVERLYNETGPPPCALHNPWEFLSAAQAKKLLAVAEFD